jgi:hypothetical protein
MFDYSKLSLEEKITLLKVLEQELHIRKEAKPTAEQLEARKCNIIANMKRRGENVVLTEYQL